LHTTSPAACLAALALTLSVPAGAEEIGSFSPIFKLLGPIDKIVVVVFED